MAFTVTEIGAKSTTGTAASCVITLTAGANIGDLVVVRMANNGIAFTGVTDSKGNTWTRSVNTTAASATGLCIAWSVLTTALVSGDTITGATGFTIDYVGEAVQITGATSTPFDQSASATNGTGSTTPSSGSTPTTTNADDMLYGAVSWQSAATFTPAVVSPTWTATTTENQHNTAAMSGHYREVTSTGAYPYAGTLSASDVWVAGIVAFKAAAGGGAVTVPLDASASTSTATLTITAQTQIPLAASISSSTAALALAAQTFIAPDASNGVSGTSMAVTAPTQIPLSVSNAVSSASGTVFVPGSGPTLFTRPMTGVGL